MRYGAGSWPASSKLFSSFVALLSHLSGYAILIQSKVDHVSFNFREADITKERIQKILASGANVVLTTGGIDDLCLKYFVEAGAMAVRRCNKADLKRISRATGGKNMPKVLSIWLLTIS